MENIKLDDIDNVVFTKKDNNLVDDEIIKKDEALEKLIDEAILEMEQKEMKEITNEMILNEIIKRHTDINYTLSDISKHMPCKDKVNSINTLSMNTNKIVSKWHNLTLLLTFICGIVVGGVLIYNIDNIIPYFDKIETFIDIVKNGKKLAGGD